MVCMDDNAAEAGAIQSRYKQMPCRHCGVMMTVGIQKRKAPAHLECSIEFSIENARQIREKSGPYYDRWLQGQRNYLENLPGGGSSTSQGG